MPDGQVISSHALQDMWLLIHAGIARTNVHPIPVDLTDIFCYFMEREFQSGRAARYTAMWYNAFYQLHTVYLQEPRLLTWFNFNHGIDK